MIASIILFTCLFAILGLLASTLRNARVLQRPSVDAGIVAAYFSSTNSRSEGVESGNFHDLGDFGESYRGYEWTKESTEVGTNGLWLEVYTVNRRSDGQVQSSISRLVFDPVSKGSLNSGGLR